MVVIKLSPPLGLTVNDVPCVADHNLSELEVELSNINWHSLGLSEV